MCTAISFQTGCHYFGRNLDLAAAGQEVVVVTPRRYPLAFRHAGTLDGHYAMIGVAWVDNGYPLFYDATNEKGLSMAGLSFPENAAYRPFASGMDNIPPFELIPWLLGQCATVAEAETLLGRLNLLQEDYSAALPLSPLHWLIADRERSLTLECVREGLRIHDNPVGVLTNNPVFDSQMTRLSDYMALSADPPENRLASSLPLRRYSNGMGALGLPGDWSSASRFVRAAFVKLHAVCDADEASSVHQFFRMLGAVSFPRGCVRMADGDLELTVYSACCNTDTGVYYYTTYDNCRIAAVDMHAEDLDACALAVHPMVRQADFFRHSPVTGTAGA